MEEKPNVTTMELKGGYRFQVDFDQESIPPLIMDEPAPLGEGDGPSAIRVLSAAVGNCLSASALHCLRKAHVPVDGMQTKVEANLVRNQQERMRVGNIKVRITIDVPEEERERANRCLGLFEEFCLVTQSVRQGVDVGVTVDVPSIATANVRHDEQC